MATENWYQNWFDTPFYHILYKERNFDEAASFIDAVIKFLKPASDSRFLDVACGRGRHAIYLNQKGYDVTGIDLADSSICEAKKHQNEKLHFYVHDMRNVFKQNQFDYALNFFTSFGYFDNDFENNKAIQSISIALKENGILLIDFMNSKKAIENLVYREEKSIDGIDFKISKKVENNFFIKNISFQHCEKMYAFEEKVQALTLEDFEQYFNQNNLKIVHLFGDYSFNKFDERNSDRLIMMVQKTNQ